MNEYRLGALLENQKLTLCSAESLTGGEFGAFVASHPGASNYFKGGMITYANDIKEKLGVKKETLETFGAVSSETASEMALSAQRFFNCDVAVSFTGNAGPSCMEGKPCGLVYIGICIKDHIQVFSNIFSGDRNEIRTKSVEFAVEVLTSMLEEKL